MCLLAGRHGQVPPTLTTASPIPSVTSTACRTRPERCRPCVSLSTSLGFGGCNAALVLASGDGPAGGRAAAETRPGARDPSAPLIRGIGVMTGWGEGPPRPRSGRSRRPRHAPVTVPTPALGGDRFRRATRECLLAVAVAKAAVAETLDVPRPSWPVPAPGCCTRARRRTRPPIGRSSRTRRRRRCTSRTPRRARCPGEVTIEFGIRGPSSISWAALRRLSRALVCCAVAGRRRADRVLVLGSRRCTRCGTCSVRHAVFTPRPLVEGTSCLLLERGRGRAPLGIRGTLAGLRSRATVASVLEGVLQTAPVPVSSAAERPGRAGKPPRRSVRRPGGARGDAAPRRVARIGPLLALTGAHRRNVPRPFLLTGTWRNEYAAPVVAGDDLTGGGMDERAILDELRDLVVKRLKFDPKVVAAVTQRRRSRRGSRVAWGSIPSTSSSWPSRWRSASGSWSRRERPSRPTSRRSGRWPASWAPGRSPAGLAEPGRRHRPRRRHPVRPRPDRLLGGLAAGRCAIGPIALSHGRLPRAHRRRGPDRLDLPGVSARRSRADRLAIVAADEAVADAGLSRAALRPAAVVVGGIGGGMLEAEAWYWRLCARAPTTRGSGGAPTPSCRPPTPTLARRYGTTGPKETVVVACSSGGARSGWPPTGRSGAVPLALAGGVDAVTRICFMGFNALKLLDPDPCRPFARDRRGMSLGEGAGFVVLEDEAHARARGARAYAELAGYGLTTDACHVTAPHPDGEGSVRAMVEALERGGVPASAVGYVNAHGTGTPQNDRAEALALRKLFDPDERPGQRQQVAHRPHHGGGRRPRGDRHRARARPRAGPAHGEPGRARSRHRLRLRAQRGASRGARVRAVELLRLRRPESEPAVPARAARGGRSRRARSIGRSRVFVTGIGSVGPLGVATGTPWAPRLREAVPAIGPMRASRPTGARAAWRRGGDLAGHLWTRRHGGSRARASSRSSRPGSPSRTPASSRASWSRPASSSGPTAATSAPRRSSRSAS